MPNEVRQFHTVVDDIENNAHGISETTSSKQPKGRCGQQGLNELNFEHDNPTHKSVHQGTDHVVPTGVKDLQYDTYQRQAPLDSKKDPARRTANGHE